MHAVIASTFVATVSSIAPRAFFETHLPNALRFFLPTPYFERKSAGCFRRSALHALAPFFAAPWASARYDCLQAPSEP